MDLHAQKRQKFRQSIRNKAIQQFKKSKRQLFQQYNQKFQHQIDQQKLYENILNNSSHLYTQGQSYLQILRQALNWSKINNYKYILPQILLSLVKFHDERQHTRQIIILLVQCIAMIFYQTNIQFDQLTKRCLIINWEYFIKNKLGLDTQKLIRNRCLIAIENITYNQNQNIFSLCQQLNILQQLQQYIEQFPTENNTKINILSIYQNIILHHIKFMKAQGQHIYYYPILLKQCTQQNYHLQILSKAVQVSCGLLGIEQINKFYFIEEMNYLYFSILNAGFYVQGTQNLIMLIGQNFVNQDLIQNVFEDVYHFLLQMFEILELLVVKYGQYVENSKIGKCFYYFGIISTKYFQQSEQQKLQQLTKYICNFWVNLEDDCSYEFQLYFLRFLRHSLSKIAVSCTLFKQMEMDIGQNNAIKAPTWQIILEFLSNVRVEQCQKIYQFLYVLQIQQINEMVIQPYRHRIVQKIEGCFYQQNGNNQISKLSQNILKIYS